MSVDVTKKLMDTDPTLRLHNEGHWEVPYLEESTGFSSFNDAGIETETGEFLYAIVRLLKPKFVLETGTHWGVGASYMAQALKDNHEGLLDTVEFLPEIHNRAVERFQKLGLDGYIASHYGDVARFVPKHQYDLILLDTEPQTRFAELIKFFDNLNEGGFVFIHDLHRHMHQIENAEHGFAWPYGKIPAEIKQMVNSDKLRPFHFSTPRGLTGFYKVSKDDYKWQA